MALDRHKCIVRVRKMRKSKKYIPNIETQMVNVGSKKNIHLLNVTIQPNYKDNPNHILASGGHLIWYQCDCELVCHKWCLKENYLYKDTARLFNIPYYIYAKCHQNDYNSNLNKIVFARGRHKFEENEYYYFLIGILSSPQNSIRHITLLYGGC